MRTKGQDSQVVGDPISIEYHPGNQHGNADAMSRRCPNPQKCKYPLLKEEILTSGPFLKCCQRAEAMGSTFTDSQGNLRSRQVHGEEAVHMVQTHSQHQGQQVAPSEPETVSTETTGKGRCRPKHGRTGCHRGNSG